MTSTTKRHPAEMRGRIGCDAQGRITGVEFVGRFKHGCLFQLGADGGEPGAGACLGALPDAHDQRQGPRDPYPWPGLGRLPGIWRAAGRAVARDALRPSCRPGRVRPAGVSPAECAARWRPVGNRPGPAGRRHPRLPVGPETALDPRAGRSRRAKGQGRRRCLLLVRLRKYGTAQPLDHPDRPVARG